MNKFWLIVIVAILGAIFLAVMDGVGHNPLAAGEFKTLSGDCLSDRGSNDLFPNADPYCITGETSEPIECTAKNPINCRDYDNKKKDNVHAVIVAESSCTMVQVWDNEYHWHLECR